MIEHVLEFGGEHLRSASQEMHLYEMLMLDVVAVIFIGLLVTIATILYCSFMLYKNCNMDYKDKKE